MNIIAVAERLNKFPSEVEAISMNEFNELLAYFVIQADEIDKTSGR